MRIDESSHLEARMREANPVPNPSDLIHSEESAAVTLLVTDARHTTPSTLAAQPPNINSRRYPTGRPNEASATALAITRRAGVSVAAFAVTILVIGGVALLRQGGTVPEVGQATSTITETTTSISPTTSTTDVTSAPGVTTTDPSAPEVIPMLGDGWDIVVSSHPGSSPFLGGASMSITDAGYYVETLGNDKYLMRRDDNEGTLVDIEVPGSGGFVNAGSGVVAWTNVGPESSTEAQLWVSSDGISFEQVAEELLEGCEGVSGCQGTQIYSAAASPSGRVVALAYDPLVWNAACDCFDLNPVALVSDDGHVWTRHALDLLSVLPAEWQGAATLSNPLVYVDGRWLTYAWRFYDDSIYMTDTAFLSSENGVDWQPVHAGALFNETYVVGLAANDRGVVAVTSNAAFWSVDGSDWTRTTLADGEFALIVAAYDDGYVAVSTPTVSNGASIGTIWYSSDGIIWSRMSLQLEEATNWNAIFGDGSTLVAIGGTENNLNGLWRWPE